MSDMIFLWAILGVCFVGGIAYAMVVARNAARKEWERCVRIIEEVVARDMNGPSNKDQAARLAANVFIAAISATHRRK